MRNRWTEVESVAAHGRREGRIWVITGAAIVASVAVILLSIVAWIIRGESIRQAEIASRDAQLFAESATATLARERSRVDDLVAERDAIERRRSELSDMLQQRDARIAILQEERDDAVHARATAESSRRSAEAKLATVEADLRRAERDARTADRDGVEASPARLPIAKLEDVLGRPQRIVAMVDVDARPGCGPTKDELDRRLQRELRRIWEVDIDETGDVLVAASVLSLEPDAMGAISFVVRLSVWARWKVPGLDASRLVEVWGGHIIATAECRTLESRVFDMMEELAADLRKAVRGEN